MRCDEPGGRRTQNTCKNPDAEKQNQRVRQGSCQHRIAKMCPQPRRALHGFRHQCRHGQKGKPAITADATSHQTFAWNLGLAFIVVGLAVSETMRVLKPYRA